MQPTISAPLIPLFLNLVDRVSDAFGVSVPPLVEMDKLRSLPPKTLGRAWADALDHAHLLPLTTGSRRKQLHDGIHVLTGYDTDAIGEAEVQAFLIGAKFRVVHLILGLGLLRLMQRQVFAQPDLSAQQIKVRLWNAYQRGDRSHFDVDAWHPETMWHLPLAQVQAQFGIDH
jgi:ubiquinone biosynthesis protein COQ4